jgi:hypothetical protein
MIHDQSSGFVCLIAGLLMDDWNLGIAGGFVVSSSRQSLSA